MAKQHPCRLLITGLHLIWHGVIMPEKAIMISGDPNLLFVCWRWFILYTYYTVHVLFLVWFQISDVKLQDIHLYEMFTLGRNHLRTAIQALHLEGTALGYRSFFNSRFMICYHSIGRQYTLINYKANGIPPSGRQ